MSVVEHLELRVVGERFRGGTLLVFMSNQLANFVTPFSRHLRDEFGIKTVLVCLGRRDLPDPALFDFDASVFHRIVEVGDVLAPRPAASLGSPADIARHAQEIERLLDIHLLDIVRTDRHVGVGFVSGGQFMRSRFAHKLSYVQAIDLAERLVRFYLPVVDEHKPFALICGYGAIHTAALTTTAEARGIPMRWPIFARTGKQMFWAENRFNWPSGLRSAYGRRLQEAHRAPSSEARLEMPYATRAFHDSMRAQLGVVGLLQRLLRVLRLELSDRARARTHRYGSYLFRDRIWLIYERWRWRRRATRLRPVMPTLPEGTPYVFFPLHIEPEVAIMSEAQAADSQLAFVEWLAKTAPGGWHVAVKEHPNATSPRPPGFMERLAQIPNVIVATPLENGESIAYKARAVAVINGTLGVQAAIAGTPVITFHRHYQARLMPHVLFADSYETTRVAMRRIERGEIAAEAERKRTGAAFKAALEDCAFDVENPGLLVGRAGNTKLGQRDVETFVLHFLASLHSRAGESGQSNAAE